MLVYDYLVKNVLFSDYTLNKPIPFFEINGFDEFKGYNQEGDGHSIASLSSLGSGK